MTPRMWNAGIEDTSPGVRCQNNPSMSPYSSTSSVRRDHLRLRRFRQLSWLIEGNIASRNFQSVVNVITRHLEKARDDLLAVG